MEETFVSGLDPQVAAKLRDAGTSRAYPPRSYIFYEGDPGSGVFIVESGLLRIDRSTANGRVVLLDLAIQGALIGELSVIDGVPRSASLSTVTACTVRYVSAEAFRTLLRAEPAIQTAVMFRLARRIRSLSNQFLENALLDAPGQVAARLLRLVEIEHMLGRLETTDDGPVDLKMPISQEELGQWAGLSREGAVKGLKTLRSVGLIETGRKRVNITSIAELKHRAE